MEQAEQVEDEPWLGPQCTATSCDTGAPRGSPSPLTHWAHPAPGLQHDTDTLGVRGATVDAQAQPIPGQPDDHIKVELSSQPP